MHLILYKRQVPLISSQISMQAYYNKLSATKSLGRRKRININYGMSADLPSTSVPPGANPGFDLHSSVI